jgi:hypothetical protein
MATALIPLNRFINIAAKVTTSEQQIYVTPTNISSIILSALCSNRTANEVTVTLKLRKIVNTVETDYFLASNIPIPPNDVLSIIAGRLVLTQSDRLFISTSANNAVDFIMSLNEAANE